VHFPIILSANYTIILDDENTMIRASATIPNVDQLEYEALMTMCEGPYRYLAFILARCHL